MKCMTFNWAYQYISYLECCRFYILIVLGDLGHDFSIINQCTIGYIMLVEICHCVARYISLPVASVYSVV